jgi:hypothetical protein
MYGGIVRFVQKFLNLHIFIFNNYAISTEKVQEEKAKNIHSFRQSHDGQLSIVQEWYQQALF